MVNTRMIFEKRVLFFEFAISIAILSNLKCTSTTEINKREPRTTNDFDVLIFAQAWPITSCMEWMSRNDDNVCVMPSHKNSWIIHGIWPSKFGTFGPEFCNSAPFDKSSLQPLMEDLRKHWINMHKGATEDSFWRYQWKKHGQCASIDELNSPSKYFNQGLKWAQQYELSDALSNANIVPGTKYNVLDIHRAVKNSLNANPTIQCVREKGRGGEQYLHEIRICFSKALELIDCDGVGKGFTAPNGDHLTTNCNFNHLVNYPSALPQHFQDRADHQTTPTWRRYFICIIVILVAIIFIVAYRCEKDRRK